MKNLDLIDVKILRFLSEDARTPFSHIARNLNLSDVAVKKRIEKLQQRGIIKGFRLDLDLKQIGYPYIVFIEVKPDPPATNTVFSRVSELPEVLETHILVGDYPILVKAALPSIEDVRRLTDLIGKMEGVLDIKTSVALESVYKPLEISEKISQRRLGGE